LDPLIPVGGPTEPIALPSRIISKPRAATARTVKIQSTALLYGRTNEISVHLTAQGDENALAFSLNFDPKLLRYLGASAGTHTLGAQLNLNAKQASDGHVGLALALATGKPLTAGEKEVAKLRFATLSPVPAAGGLGFGDLPIIREIASVTAESLPVTWQSQALTVVSPNLGIIRDPASGLPSIQLSWPAAYSNAQLESASEPNLTAWNQITVSPTTVNGINTVSIPLTEANSYYRLKVP
jgi:hypothetical protein